MIYPSLYECLTERHAKDLYKRGGFKGDAPAGPRYKTHYRIIKAEGCMYVHFHRTKIITAHQDGTVMLDSNGYHDSTTTRAAFADWGYYLGTKNENGYKQPMLHRCTLNRSGSKVAETVVFYDGMKLSPTGQLLGDRMPIKGYRVDTAKSRAWRAEPHMVQFRTALPVLWEGINQMDPRTRVELRYAAVPTSIRLQHFEDPTCWPSIIAAYLQSTVAATWALINKDMVTRNFRGVVGLEGGDEAAA